MKMSYAEYNQLFNLIADAINKGEPLPPNKCRQWRDYAIVLQDVCNELKIHYEFVGSIKASMLHKKPVFMGNELYNLPFETREIVNDFQKKIMRGNRNYKAELTSVHADQCNYLVLAY